VGREEVAQRSGGQPDLSSHGSDGRRGDTVADYDPPHALGDGLAALVVVDELRHGARHRVGRRDGSPLRRGTAGPSPQHEPRQERIVGVDAEDVLPGAVSRPRDLRYDGGPAVDRHGFEHGPGEGGAHDRLVAEPATGR
jgi:hypothetical protein